MKLHHFYHIYADGQCEQPMREHIFALKEYGLYGMLTTFKIGLVGSEQKRKEAIHCLRTLGVEFEICAEAETGWEQVTMIPMWEFCQKNDGLILYAHTKGAHNTFDVNIRWRRSMIWHNVCQWKYAVEKLETHEMYGCHWIQPLLTGMPEHRQGNFMFAGTFFWGWCKTIGRFPRPALTHRHEAEGFCGYGYAEKPFPVWDCCPYFPNTNAFMDGWLGNPDYRHDDLGKSIPAQETINILS